MPGLFGLLLILASLAEALAHLPGPRIVLSDYLYWLMLALHLGVGIFLVIPRRWELRRQRERLLSLMFKAPDVLMMVALVLFLFSFIFATNANMDYVQRFIASGGNLKLAPDSRLERWDSVLRFVPLLGLDLFANAYPRLRKRRVASRMLGSASPLRQWALPATLLSSLLYAFSFPSFLSLTGWFPLAYVSVVPLILVFLVAPPAWAVFYGVSFGIVQNMVANYWLGTFSLVSLQFLTVVMCAEYFLFMVPTVAALKRAGPFGFLVVPAAWVAFDLFRSRGFLGYPWGMIGVTQHPFLPLIQVASLLGVWGVSFIVLVCNAAIAWWLASRVPRMCLGARPIAKKEGLRAVLVAAAIFAGTTAGGLIFLSFSARSEAAGRHVRIAAVQQNSDPRKSDYTETFGTLKRLTLEALAERPDIVVWSETAFVPNIRRWSSEDPEEYPLAALVRDFLQFQRSIGMWLLTGNDDYELRNEGGEEVRLDYNAAVFFSPSGDRVETYHKIHLVPFTEYFPFKKQLPGIYDFLTHFDVYLWEPGTRRVVFRHPLFSFSTPICFEDAFPQDVRAFVRAGAEVIVNISNDYWSLTPVEAKQHAINAIFGAVANRVPFVRVTASGLTCSVDPAGKILLQAPYYQPSFIIADVALPQHSPTLYTRWGDWFPFAMIALAIAAVAAAELRRRDSS